VKEARYKVANIDGRLKLLSPDNVLARGYSITSDAASGTIIRTAAKVKPGQKMVTRVRDGKIGSVVSEALPTKPVK
jgi:exodeoxyribonuclease VII large subunit